jgi:6-pyruvoyltetrahydropterin/6-carboxytetrahydropterin synthase
VRLAEHWACINSLKIIELGVVTKETMTVEGMIKIVYDLLKDKLNIVKLTFTSGVNGATEEYEPKNKLDRCPLCGIALNENGVFPKCGYKK